MMTEDLGVKILATICIFVIFVPFIWMFIEVTTQSELNDKTEIDNGEVTSKKIESDFRDRIHLITLDNETEYEVTESEYLDISVGDDVVVYKSGRVEKE